MTSDIGFEEEDFEEETDQETEEEEEQDTDYSTDYKAIKSLASLECKNVLKITHKIACTNCTQ